MNFHDHKTFLALLKATTKDPFGVSGAAVRNRPPSGQMLAKDQTSEGQNKLELLRSQRRSGGPRPAHTFETKSEFHGKALRVGKREKA